jgi:CDP-glycerol glycerophosphotransferase
MDSEAEMQEVEKKHAGIHCVKRGSFEFFRSLAQAKIIITNSNFIYPPGFHTCIRKQKNKVIVQTWHGSLGIKQLNTTPRLKSNLKAGKKMDFIISNSSFETEVYRESYWKTAKILEYGHPRNDMLINSSSEYVSRLKRDFYNMYNISPDTKLCLYAPTFPLTTVNSIYTIDYEMLMQALTVCFGKNWLILNRLHHRSIMSMKFNSVPEYCLDVSNYPDIQELMLIINVGVTDYSSWIYDFVLTRKPGFIFAPDIQQYDQIRGFYYPITETPFPVAYDNSMLYKNIISFNDIAYQTNIDSFLAAKGCIEDGKASKRVVELIEKILNN